MAPGFHCGSVTPSSSSSNQLPSPAPGPTLVHGKMTDQMRAGASSSSTNTTVYGGEARMDLMFDNRPRRTGGRGPTPRHMRIPATAVRQYRARHCKPPSHTNARRTTSRCCRAAAQNPRYRRRARLARAGRWSPSRPLQDQRAAAGRGCRRDQAKLPRRALAMSIHRALDGRIETRFIPWTYPSDKWPPAV